MDNASSVRVLIIDDDVDTADVLQLSLKESGLSADVAHSSSEALKVLMLQPPDLILLDYMLPGEQGPRDVVEFVRSRGLKSRIVLVTGYGEICEVARSLKVEYAIQKPFDFDELIKLIYRIVGVGNHANT